jgi:CBS domain-containing protein
MHRGVLSCPPETDLVSVARMMATNHIHAVVVSGTEPMGDGNQRLVWALISDLDLVAAAREGGVDREAAEVAGTEIVVVFPDEPLEKAAQVMVEHALAHLLVVGRETGLPIGVVSTLDVAGVLAWGEA